MSLVLDTTVSGEYANTYVDQVYADDYWTDHYSSVKSALWATLATAQKINALAQATRVLDILRFTEYMPLYSEYQLMYDWRSRSVLSLDLQRHPVKAAFFQNLQFPRNLDRDSNSGAYYIPEAIKMAQCEQAVYLLSFDDSNLSSRLQGLSRESLAVGTISVHTQFDSLGSTLSPVAFDIVRPYVLKRNMSLKRA